LKNAQTFRFLSTLQKIEPFRRRFAAPCAARDDRCSFR
jgi:hypothetical protein